jgi:hypothetical protein
VEIKTTTIHRDGSRETFYNLKNEGQHQRSAGSLTSFKSEDSLKIVGLQHVVNDSKIVVNNLGSHRNIKVVMKRRDHSMQTTQSLQEKLAQITQQEQRIKNYEKNIEIIKQMNGKLQKLATVNKKIATTINDETLLSFFSATRDPETLKLLFRKALDPATTKTTIMQPLPFHCGMVHFTIRRNRKGLNRLSPIITLYIDLQSRESFPLLSAKKRSLMKKSGYQISLGEW